LTNVAQIEKVDVNEAHRVLIKYESEFSVTVLFCLDSILYKFLDKPVFLKHYYESAKQAHEISPVDDTESDSDSNNSPYTNYQLHIGKASQMNRHDDTESDNDNDLNTDQIAATTKSQKGNQRNKRKQLEDRKYTEKKYRTKIFGKEDGSMPFNFAKKLTMHPTSP